MRHPLALVVGLILATNSLVTGQDAPNSGSAHVATPILTPSIDSEVPATGAILKYGCPDCANQFLGNCSNPCCARRKLVLRRYYWIPAAYAGLHTRVVATGYAFTRISGTYAPAAWPGGQYVGYPGTLNVPGTIGTNSTGIIATGPVALHSSGVSTLPVLPASPYRAHPSYAAYSQPPSSGTYRTYTHGSGLVGTGFTGVPVYPTTQFRRTSGFVAPIPMPHYAGY